MTPSISQIKASFCVNSLIFFLPGATVPATSRPRWCLSFCRPRIPSNIEAMRGGNRIPVRTTQSCCTLTTCPVRIDQKPCYSTLFSYYDGDYNICLRLNFALTNRQFHEINVICFIHACCNLILTSGNISILLVFPLLGGVSST